MALVLKGNYSKKIGLAGYSSHQFSLTLKTEITDIAQVPAEAARLYRLLQDGVDTSIKEVGFLPDPSTAMAPATATVTPSPSATAPAMETGMATATVTPPAAPVRSGTARPSKPT